METETNGLLTYDRQPKIDVDKISRINHFLIPPATYDILVPTSETNPQDWKYTLDPPAADWTKKDFDDSAWTMGKGGFGSGGRTGVETSGTPWKTANIWLRRTFNPGALTVEQIANLVVRDFHDGDVEVYLNGVLAYRGRWAVAHYENQFVYFGARRALLPNAENVLAVSCKRTGGGQSIDVGLSLRERHGG